MIIIIPVCLILFLIFPSPDDSRLLIYIIKLYDPFQVITFKSQYTIYYCSHSGNVSLVDLIKTFEMFCN